MRIVLVYGKRALASLLLIVVAATGAPVLCVSAAHVSLEVAGALCCGLHDATGRGNSSPIHGLSPAPGCGDCIDLALSALMETAPDARTASRAGAAVASLAFVRPASLPPVLLSSSQGQDPPARSSSTEIPLPLRC